MNGFDDEMAPRLQRLKKVAGGAFLSAPLWLTEDNKTLAFYGTILRPHAQKPPIVTPSTLLVCRRDHGAAP